MKKKAISTFILFTAVFSLILSTSAIAICTETDGGNDPGTFGEARSSGRFGRDMCRITSPNGGYAFAESCSGSNCYIEEVYCTSITGSDTITSETTPCPQGCKGGQCGGTPSNNQPPATSTNPSPAIGTFNACDQSSTRYAPRDTICSSDWQSQGGATVPARFAIDGGVGDYGTFQSCVYHEVCNPSIDPFIDEAMNCCTNGEDSPQCDFARQYSQNSQKTCLGLYIIKSGDLGRYNPYSANGGPCCASGAYPEWRFWCDGLARSANPPAVGSNYYGTCLAPGGTGTAGPSPYDAQLKSMACDVSREGIIYDNPVLEQNSCVSLTYGPTSLILNQLKISGCTQHASIVTTLLRKAGYSSTEVITVSSKYHYFNLVKFPILNKFVVIDNYHIMLPENPQQRIGLDSICRWNWVDCHNDNGVLYCPARENIIGCEAYGGICHGCSYDGRCYAVGEQACVDGIQYQCTGQNAITALGTCNTPSCNGCLHNGTCYEISQSYCNGGREYICNGINQATPAGSCGTNTTTNPCPNGCNYNGQCMSIGQSQCSNGQQMTCTAPGNITNTGSCCNGCVVDGACRAVGDQQCVNGELFACASPGNIENRGSCCPGGCLNNGQCVPAGTSQCVNFQNYTCTSTGTIQNTGVCCPGGCVYDNRCYIEGETECISGTRWQCMSENNAQPIGKCSGTCDGCEYLSTCYGVGTEGCISGTQYRCMAPKTIIPVGTC